jgi:hypothetical protein
MFWNKEESGKNDFYQNNELRLAFDRIKKDIFSLGSEISSIKSEFFSISQQINTINDAINFLKVEFLIIKNQPKQQITQNSGFENQFLALENQISELKEQLKNLQLGQKYLKLQENIVIPTHFQAQNPDLKTDSAYPSDNPTVPKEIGGLKYPILDTSKGNRGVPTDRQTNQQTDNSSTCYTVKEVLSLLKSPSITPENVLKSPLSVKDRISQASEILESLDSIKKEIRLKFKGITNQEMLVFSTIYQLESEFPEGVEYRQIASKLDLSESSIRDYIQKLISKGIPVDKTKVNNKKICLKISSELKKIAPLQTLIRLREL